MAAAGHPLTDETVLIVEEFVFVEGAEKPQSLNTSKLIMRPERVSEEHLDPFQGPAGLPI
jgi:hypothetical protein